MAIHKIDDVKINGRNQAFGGYIYSVDVNVGLIDNPTEIVVNFINESGTYLEPELSVTKPYRIQVGNVINDNFYAVSRTIAKSSDGRTLEVKFVDGSIILDRIWVSLYKRGGDDKTNIPGLIIVGREIHPCDVNEDGVFDQTDANLLSWKSLDPCELKCPGETSEVEPVIENCITKETTELFEVKYSFDDLLNALTGVPSSVSTAARTVAYPVPKDLDVGSNFVTATLPPMLSNPNTNRLNQIKVASRPRGTNRFYLAQYTGTLRDVLRSWCADFGWSFYWENDALNFIDTKERPKINDAGFQNVQSLTDVKTIEGTVARGFISHYAQGGITAQKSCSRNTQLLLRCLTLRDLFGEVYKPAWNAIAYQQNDYASGGKGTVTNPPIPDPTDSSPDNQIEYLDDVYGQGVNIEKFETSVVLSYYSDALRHLYTLWNYYGIKNSTDARLYKNKWMDRLGQMKIINVFAANSPDQIDRTRYEKLLAIDARDNNKKSAFSEEEVQRIKARGGYIVVALRNNGDKKEDLLDKQFRIEENLASNFFGQHWYRAYTSPHFGESPQIFPNGQYFGALSTNIKDLPFANFNHTYQSNISKMVSSFVQRQRPDYRQYGNLRYTINFSKNISKKIVRSIVYFGRNTSDAWLPLKNASTQFRDLLTEVEKYMFFKKELTEMPEEMINECVAKGDGTPQPLVDKKFWHNVQVFVFYPQPQRGLEVSIDFVDNPNKENPQYSESREAEASVTVGMLGNKCARYNVNGVLIYTPAGGSVGLNGQHDKFRWVPRDPERRDFDSPAYKVLITTSTENRGVIPKTEISIIEPANRDSAMKVEYQTKEIDKNAMQFLNSLTSECNIDPQKLQEIHDKFAANLNYSVTQPFHTKTYRIMGVTMPSKVSIRDGLESVKVRVDENGIFTDIGLGDTLFTPPSPDLILRALELHKVAELANLKTNVL